MLTQAVWTLTLTSAMWMMGGLAGCSEVDAEPGDAVRPATQPGDAAAGQALAGYDALLARHVDADGFVDYAALARDTSALDAYIASLAGVPLETLERDARLATLINAYNAFTLRLILDHWDEGQLASIMDIPEAKRWNAVRWKLAGQMVSLDQLEHTLIRPVFQEPRVHWALVCAAYSCPPLRVEAYRGEALEKQLADQARYVHSRPRYLQYDGGDTIQLTVLYDWFAADFAEQGGALEHATRYAGEDVAEAIHKQKPEVTFLDYDWKLNRKANRVNASGDG